MLLFFSVAPKNEKVHGKKKERKFNENMRRDTGKRKISGNESSKEKRLLPATG